ncbi:outer membrane protein A [Halomonas sp. THAF5a]|uniref:porin family protein n=1 Tax=Halomonas sp. THAF5a TaxID=2587844 RepID=UPI0012694964|nr:porin family protein [Halomonas sp. THAF5a]QFU03072.1 outer membrane protein A [Halomonas sp. THAF5a]
MTRLLAIAALATLLAVPALAQERRSGPHEGPYLGAGIGHATLDNAPLDGLERLGANADDSDTGYTLLAGYRFTPHVAVEAGHMDLGEASTRGADGAGGTPGMEGVTAALIGRLPIANGFSLHGKLGVIAYDTDLDLDAEIDGQPYDVGADEEGTDPFYGIGAEYAIQRLLIRGEYERYDIGESGEDVEIDRFSASVGYHF